MKNFGDFLCFEMMYPQVVAGPIIRYSEIEDQLHFRRSTANQVRAGHRRSSRSAWRRRC